MSPGHQNYQIDQPDQTPYSGSAGKRLTDGLLNSYYQTPNTKHEKTL
jgi:hypothetical protein